MLLEAFSCILHKHWDPVHAPASHLLRHWLLQYLLDPITHDNIGRILKTELTLIRPSDDTPPVIVARSITGQALLNSFTHYCESYEQWMFRRWLHQANASQFNQHRHEPPQAS